eukprot:gene6871-13931_t
MITLPQLVVICCSLVLFVQSAPEKKTTKKSDPNDNKGNTPFFLQDPQDQMCLGPNGFTICNENALWILTKRAGKKTYSMVSLMNPNSNEMCLERKSTFFGMFGTDRVGMGQCNKRGAKSWNFEFIDAKHVKLSNQGQCLVRGKRKYRNSVTVQSCKKGASIPLLYHPTAVHEVGFYLKSADGGCFDGTRYKSCETNANKLLWGIGIKYIWGKANRYFFNFFDKTQCIVARGSKIEKGDCRHPGALSWGLQDGKFTHNNGKKCVARLLDHSGTLTKCSDSYEYTYMDVPSTYTSEELAGMVKNQDNLTPEERKVLQQIIKQ